MTHRLVMALCLSLLFGLLLPPTVVAQDKIRVGLSSVSALHGALWVAEQKGTLRKYGIEAEVIVVGGAGTTGVSALLANDIQYVSAAGDAIINSDLEGNFAQVRHRGGSNRGRRRWNNGRERASGQRHSIRQRCRRCDYQFQSARRRYGDDRQRHQQGIPTACG